MHARPARGGLHLAVALVLTVLATGCASAGRLAAVKLADDGIVASKEAETLISQTSDTLSPYVEGQFLVAPLRGTAPPDEMLLATIAKVETALALRVNVMAKLAKCYEAMKQHASYDAAGEVEKSVSELTGSINAYGAVFAPGAALISSKASLVLAKAAGAAAGNKQLRQLKAASAAIRERLQQFRGVFTKEANLLESISRVTTSTSATNAQAIWRLGIGQPDSILTSLLKTYGLEYDPEQFPTVLKALEAQQTSDAPPDGCSSPCNTKADRLRFGVSQVVRQRAIRSMALTKAALSKQSDTLVALEDAHRDFETDQFVDDTVVAAELEMLKTTVDELNALRGK